MAVTPGYSRRKVRILCSSPGWSGWVRDSPVSSSPRCIMSPTVEVMLPVESPSPRFWGARGGQQPGANQEVVVALDEPNTEA